MNLDIDTLLHLIQEYLNSPRTSRDSHVEELLQNATKAIEYLSHRLVTERAKVLLAEEELDDLK